MRLLTLFIALIGAFSVNAQFEIDSFVQEGQYGDANKFPIVRSLENAKAAERINTVLHQRMLEKVYREEDDNRFDQVVPPEGEFQGASEFDFEVTANNGRFFSISISCAYTGAYSEYHTTYFNFDAVSGQPVNLLDIFSDAGYSELSDWVTAAIYSEINEFMNGIDVSDEYGSEQFDMYAECISWFDDVQELPQEAFYMTDSVITFVRGRCSNHMMMALDELWEFHEEYSLVELTTFMSENGKALVYGGTMNFDHLIVPTGKILQGKIAGKYPITMVLRHSYDNYYSGEYWYNKVKQPIALWGETDNAGYLHLTEKVNEKTTGKFDLQILQGGTLEGEWSNADGTKKLDVVLSIDK